MKGDCNYDKTKLLHELSRVKHFARKHAIEDAKKEGHPLCAKMYEEIAADAEKQIDKLKAAIAGLAREGKFI